MNPRSFPWIPVENKLSTARNVELMGKSLWRIPNPALLDNPDFFQVLEQKFPAGILLEWVLQAQPSLIPALPKLMLWDSFLQWRVSGIPWKAPSCGTLGCVIPEGSPWKTGILNPNQNLIPNPIPNPDLLSGDWELQTEQSSSNALIQELPFGGIFPIFPLWDGNFLRPEVSKMWIIHLKCRLFPQNSQSRFLMLQESSHRWHPELSETSGILSPWFDFCFF